MSEVVEPVVVPNAQGLHARPSALIVKTAGEFEAEITIENPEEDCVVDAKMLLEVMTLVAPQGTELIISAEGDDAADAVASLVALVSAGFNEE